MAVPFPVPGSDRTAAASHPQARDKKELVNSHCSHYFTDYINQSRDAINKQQITCIE